MHKLDSERCNTLVRRASRQLYLYCKNHGIHFLVTGSSGGRDSAVTLALAEKTCQLAKKNKYELKSVGVVLPCDSASKYTRLGRLAVKTFNALLVETDLTADYFDVKDNFITLDDQVGHILKTQIDVPLPPNFGKDWQAWTKKICNGNIKARLRMITLYHIARKLGSGMVLSTDNLSELWMGFWTICGDVGDYGMIQSVLKGLELEDLCVHLGVPDAILAQPPDDGLGVTKQGDAGQLGAVYSEVDRIMVSLIQQGFNPDGSKQQLKSLPIVPNADPKLVESLAARALGTAFKRGGTVNLTRKHLGLPEVKHLDLT